MRWIVKGAIFSFAFIIVNKLLWYIFRVILANYLGPEAYGTFSFAFAVLSLFATLASFGFPLAMERYIAYHKSVKAKRGIILFALNFVALLSSTLLILVEISKFFDPTVSVFLLAIPFVALTNVIAGVLRAHGKIEYPIIGALVYAVINVIFALAAMKLNLSIHFIAAGFVLAYAVNFILATFFLNKVIKLRFEMIEKERLLRILNFSWPLATAGMLGFIIMWTDTLMLNYFEGREIVGYYNAAVPIAKVSLIFAFSINSLFLPEISRRLAERMELKGVVSKVYQLNLMLTLTAVGLLAVFPSLVISTVFSPLYVPASIPLSILSVGILFNALSQTTTRILSLLERTRPVLYANGAAAFTNVILNFLLIPHFSMIGAASASAASMALQFFLLLIPSQKLKFSIQWKPAFVIISIAAASFILKSLVGNLAIILYTTSLVYLYFALREEIKMVLRMLFDVAKLS